MVPAARVDPKQPVGMVTLAALLAAAGALVWTHTARAGVIVADIDPGGGDVFVATADIETDLNAGFDFTIDVGVLAPGDPAPVVSFSNEVLWSTTPTLAVQRGSATGVSVLFDAAGQSINGPGGQLRIDVDASVAQGLTDQITVNRLTIDNAGSVDLTNAGNDFDDVSVMSAGSVNLTDQNGLTVSGDIVSQLGAIDVVTGGSLAVASDVRAQNNLSLRGLGVAIATGSQLQSLAGDLAVRGGSGTLSVGQFGQLLSLGRIELTADSLDLANTSQVGGGIIGGSADTVILRPFTAGADMTLGTPPGPAAVFDLSDDALATVRATNLFIGDQTAGALDIGQWTPSAATVSGVLTLASGAGISATGPLNLNAGGAGLLLRGGGPAELGNPANRIGDLAATLTSGGLTLTSQDTLRIATLVDDFGAVAGIDANGNVSLAAPEILLAEAGINANGNVDLVAPQILLAQDITATGGVTLIGETDVDGQRGIDAQSFVVNGGLSFDLAGTGSQEFDSITLGDVPGRGVFINGLVEIALASSFNPQVGDIFDLITAGVFDIDDAEFDLPTLSANRFFTVKVEVIDVGRSVLRAKVMHEPAGLLALIVGLGGLAFASARPGRRATK